MLKIALLEGCVYECDVCYVYSESVGCIIARRFELVMALGGVCFCIGYCYGINNEGMIRFSYIIKFATIQNTNRDCSSSHYPVFYITHNLAFCALLSHPLTLLFPSSFLL
jgi:hypothetical protein